MSVAYPEPGEIRIRRSGEDWITIPIESPLIPVQQVASFPSKVTIGDPEKGSHPLLSTWSFGGLTGGSGIAYHDATTSRRYRMANADTRNAKFFASPLQTQSYQPVSADYMPHNDLVVSGTRRHYGSFGTDLYLFAEPSTFTDTTFNLSAAAVNPGVAFSGTSTLKLFIPCGTTGYARWTGAALTNVAAAAGQPAARDFCKLGQQLICLDTAGQLWSSVDGTTWTSYGSYGKLDLGITGYRLEIFKNGFGDQTLHISTSQGMFTFDPAGPTLYETELQVPPHPYVGLALERWRDQIYYSAGLGDFSWNGSAINAMGLDRSQSLPNGYRGYIADMVGTLNGLFALVAPYENLGFASLHEWTGEGWQCHWEAEGGSPSPTTTKLVVSSAESKYRVWWGYDNNARSLPINPDFANAEQLAASATGSFAQAWYLMTGMQAMEMDGFAKIAVSLTFEEFSASDHTIFVYARTDPAANFALITSFPNPGTSTTGRWIDRNYEFGPEVVDGVTRYFGMEFEQIEFGFFGRANGAYTGPQIIKNPVLTFQKVIEGYRAWSTTIRLKQLHDEGQEDFSDLINELVLDNEYCLLQYQQEIIRAKFGSWGGADETGQASHGGVRNVSIIEIPATP